MDAVRRDRPGTGSVPAVTRGIRPPSPPAASERARRPRLAAAVRRLWRDGQTLQLGVATDQAVVLAGIDDHSRAVLSLLDGTRDEAAVLADAEQRGCSRAVAATVLELLAAAGVLDDAADPADLPRGLTRPESDRLAPDLAALRLLRRRSGGGDALRRRAAARVVVVGAGRVGAPLAALLACSGVGTVDVIDDGLTRPADCGVGGLDLAAVGTQRGLAARALVSRSAPSARTGPVITPHLVVLAPAAGAALPEGPRAEPTLVAQVVDGIGVVGPLVHPRVSACLRCIELHRTDLDPGWPALSAQLSVETTDVTACDAGLALAVAAQAVREALAFLDAHRAPATVGGTLELSGDDWRWRRRSWQVHPDCDCGLDLTG